MYLRHPMLSIDLANFSNLAPLPHVMCAMESPPLILANFIRHRLKELRLSNATFSMHPHSSGWKALAAALELELRVEVS